MTIIRVSCGWCGKDLGQKNGQGQEGTSHGICSDCLGKEMARMTGPIAQKTALIHIRPDTDPRVVALYQEGVRLREWAEKRVIQSDDDVRLATDDLSVISGLKRAIEEKRREYVGPINDHLKAVNDGFKFFTEPLNQADSITRKKVLDYRAEQERQRKEQDRINALRAEAARAEMGLKGELSEPVGLVEVAPEPPAHYRTDAGTLGKAMVWRFEVEDFNLLPNEYKLPDMTKIRRVVVAGVVIPGVKSWQEESLRVTPR